MDVRVRNNVHILGVDGAPTVMLAHGFGCDQEMWRRVTAPLSERFRIVLFDHVGSGGADPSAWDPDRYASLDGYASDILDIVDGLELRDAVFVGHSVAAMMGVLAAGARSRRLREAGAGDAVAVLHRRRRLSAADSPAPTSTICSTRWKATTWAGHAPSRSTIVGNPGRPELSEELAETFCRTDPACAKVFARTTFLSDNRADLSKVSVPTLILECAEDVIAPAGVGSYVAAHIAGSKLVTLDTTGHCPQLSAPEATAAEITSFVDGSP